MPYSLIVAGAVITLALYYVLTIEASFHSKVLVLGMLGLCLACRFWWHRYSLAALFGLVGLGLFLSFYRIISEARATRRRH